MAPGGGRLRSKAIPFRKIASSMSKLRVLNYVPSTFRDRDDMVNRGGEWMRVDQ